MSNRVLDSNGNGQIARAELIQGFLARGLAHDEMVRASQLVDEDQDTCIEWNEFVTLAQIVPDLWRISTHSERAVANESDREARRHAPGGIAFEGAPLPAGTLSARTHQGAFASYSSADV